MDSNGYVDYQGYIGAQTLGQLTDDELTIGSYHDTASISSDPQTQESICSVHSVEVIEDPFGKDNEKEVGIIVDLDKGKDEEWRPQKRQRIDQGTPLSPLSPVGTIPPANKDTFALQSALRSSPQLPPKPSWVDPSDSPCAELSFNDMMQHYRSFSELLKRASNDGVNETGIIRTSLDKKFEFLTALETSIGDAEKLMNNTTARLKTVQNALHAQTIGVLNKNAKSLEQCQDIRRREKRLKNVINERQKSIVDSLEKMAETVGS